MSDWSPSEGQEAAVDKPNGLFARVWEAFEAGRFVIACAWCGRVRIDDAWFDAPRSVFAAVDADNVLSHSICEDCAQTANGSVAMS
jgi:hypothetical protein